MLDVLQNAQKQQQEVHLEETKVILDDVLENVQQQQEEVQLEETKTMSDGLEDVQQQQQEVQLEETKAMSDVLENVQVQPVSPQLLLPREGFMQKFRLYETRSKFYMVGRDKSKKCWKVLIIDRLEPSELNIREDSTIYTARECSDLLSRVNDGNKATGGLKFVTSCYGIVGFIKFFGPYYMLLITKRRQIGEICGHIVYAISKCEIVPVPNSAVRSSMVKHKNENRYKKLLCMVDLTKDFYFSYSYHVMMSLQKNMCDNVTGQVLYETIFVWNEFLTHGIRNILQNTIWTVALVYGFFKQTTFSISGRDLRLTLIARRSRHYAGTRYLKRGVNETGRVANDVETEQIVVEDVTEGVPMQISSVVQNRGSIPLFWSQKTSRMIIKPDIILSKRDQTYKATRLHFENLVKRYGNPIIILNLIKTNEKKPRESILRAEFANAIEVINMDLPDDNKLKFLHFDLHRHSKSKATDVLMQLHRVAAYALGMTCFFYCQGTPTLLSDGHLKWPNFENFAAPDMSTLTCSQVDCEKHIFDANGDSDNSDRKHSGDNSYSSVKPPMVQKGVLRTNCIDCLDRTNVAQYAYGLAALGHQLHALGVTTSKKISLDDPLAEELMGLYETMGDTLAHQYGGSAAHNKIFSERRGQWKAATQSQEFLRTLQRYYSNAYMDAEKQNSINIFLGLFQPQPGQADIWEFDSYQHYNVGRNGQSYIDEIGRSFFKRSWSDGNILRQTQSPRSTSNIHKDFSVGAFTSKSAGGDKLLSESAPEISTSESDLADSSKELFVQLQREKFLGHENRGEMDSSNFVNLDWLSSSADSCDEELLDRSMLLSASSSAVLSSEDVINEIVGDTTPSISDCGSSNKGREHIETDLCFGEAHNNYDVLEEFTDSFVQWVTSGETLCH